MRQHTGHRTEPSPCLRHPRVWLASCTDCTDWHLSRQIAARGVHRRTAGTATLRLVA